MAQRPCVKVPVESVTCRNAIGEPPTCRLMQRHWGMAGRVIKGETQNIQQLFERNIYSLSQAAG